MISTSGIFQEREQESCRRKQIPHDKTVRNDKALEGMLISGAHARNSMAFRPEKNATFGARFTQPETEDKKLRKDPSWRFLALKVPFGKCLPFRMKSRGRDN